MDTPPFNPTLAGPMGMDVTADLTQRLLRERIVFLGSVVDQQAANTLCAQLLLLEAEDPEQDISLYINSPGGSVTDGLAIYDTMQYVSNDVRTICVGMAASMGQFLLCAGTAGKRFALPNSRILMHQPSAGGIQGQARVLAMAAVTPVRLGRRWCVGVGVCACGGVSEGGKKGQQPLAPRPWRRSPRARRAVVRPPLPRAPLAFAPPFFYSRTVTASSTQARRGELTERGCGEKSVGGGVRRFGSYANGFFFLARSLSRPRNAPPVSMACPPDSGPRRRLREKADSAAPEVEAGRRPRDPCPLPGRLGSLSPHARRENAVAL